MDFSAIRTSLAPIPQGDIDTYIPILSLCAALFLIGSATALRFRRQASKRAMAQWFMISAVCASVIYWFRYEGVLYFDSDIWLVIALGIFVGYGIRYLYIQFKRYPHQQLIEQKQSTKEKYLPKKKNR